MVPDSRSSCTEGSVAQVGARLTDEKRTTSVRRAQSSWAGVDDEAAVVSQAGSVPTAQTSAGEQGW